MTKSAKHLSEQHESARVAEKRELMRRSLIARGMTGAIALILSSLYTPSADARTLSSPDSAIPSIKTTPQKTTQAAVSVAAADPTPLLASGQFTSKPRHHHAKSRHHKPVAGSAGDIRAANAAARMQPVREGFVNAIQHYPFTDGALYQLYAAPGEVTDIVLQEGEQLVGAGPVAAGDTVRWIIGDTSSGTGAGARVHILVKPTRSGLVTNLVINTDRRSYHIEMHATPSTYMASLSWDYPQDALIALRTSQAAAAKVAPIASGIDVTALNFNYALTGDNPRWKPLRAFDDATRVFIEFPDSVAQGDMPPLFVIGASGTAELVNYRVTGTHMIVDKLFDAAELRLGDKKSTQSVRITRVVAKARRGFHL